jgi:hypothetical protein
VKILYPHNFPIYVSWTILRRWNQDQDPSLSPCLTYFSQLFWCLSYNRTMLGVTQQNRMVPRYDSSLNDSSRSVTTLHIYTVKPICCDNTHSTTTKCSLAEYSCSHYLSFQFYTVIPLLQYKPYSTVSYTLLSDSKVYRIWAGKVY